MRRIRWLSSQWPISLRTIASKMKFNAFTQDSYDGFIIERVRDTSVAARYVEKITYKETVTDPFGNEDFFDRVIYRQVAFNLFADFPNIELLDSPRSTQGYISKLLELCNFSLSVDSLQVHLLEWVEAFQSQLSKNVIIDSIQIAGLELEPGVSAKILVQGDKDVRAALTHFAKNKRYVLEKLQIKVPFDGNSVPIHLTNNGSARISKEVFDDLLPMLRSSLNSVKT